MNRKASVLFIIALLTGIFGFLFSNALAATQYETGFETFNTGSLNGQDSWTTSGTANVQTTTVNYGSKAVEVLVASSQETKAERTFSGTNNGIQWVDTYIRFSSNVSGIYIGESPAKIAAFVAAHGNYIQGYKGDGAGSGSWNMAYAVNSGKWYRITLRIDFTNKTYDVYVDGLLRQSKLTFRHNTAASLNWIKIYTQAGTGTSLYFDDLKIKTDNLLYEYQTGFEEFTTGSINGQNGWSVTSGAANIQTTTVNGGAKALQLVDGASVSTVTYTQAGAKKGSQWVVFDVWPDSTYSTLEIGQSSNTINLKIKWDTNNFYVYDGNNSGGGTWIDLGSYSNRWQRIAIWIDYKGRRHDSTGDGVFDVYVDGVIKKGNIRFSNCSGTSLDYVRLSKNASTSKSMYIDDLSIGAQRPEKIYYSGFEDDSTGSINGVDGWSTNGGTVSVQASVARGGAKALEFPSSTMLIELSRSMSGQNDGIQWIDSYIRPADIGGGMEIGESSTSLAALVDFTTGYIKVFDGNGSGGGNWSSIMPYDHSKWYRISLKINHFTNKWDFYVGGRRVNLSELGFKHNSSSELAWLKVHRDAGTGSKMFFDQLLIWEKEPAFNLKTIYNKTKY